MPAAKRSSTHVPTFFASPAAFRAWLDQYGATTQELIVGFHKVGSGKPSITWPESVDEVLCVGWIDGVRKRIDDTAYQIRFTPRRKSSIWSGVNIARVAALQAEGRMTKAGLAAFALRTERRSNVYAYEQETGLSAIAVRRPTARLPLLRLSHVVRSPFTFDSPGRICTLCRGRDERMQQWQQR